MSGFQNSKALRSSFDSDVIIIDEVGTERK